MTMNYTIYCHRNKINNKAYIGQTSCTPYTKRWTGSGSPYEKCRYFQNAINKYGWEKIRQKRLGSHASEETKKKISEATKGKNNPRAKTVLCVNTGEVFDTAKDAAQKYNCDHSSICKCCNGKVKSCGRHPETNEKLVWKYI